MRTHGIKLLALVFLFLEFSCGGDLSECPNKMCVIAGEWRLTEVYVDDTKETEDLSQYKLTLSMPNPMDAVVAEFTRTQPGGTTDSGLWSIENNETILRLIPDGYVSLTENWVIEKFTPRQLILVITRDTGIKDGPGRIEFILEPF